MTEDARWLDGNALGGLLHELYGAEMTTTSHTCESCGQTNPVAKHRLYIGAGAVLRCPVCGHVAMAIATLRDRHEVHMSGAWADRLPVP